MSAETTVYVEPSSTGRWRVVVRYGGTKPVTLLSAPSRDEAMAAARGYAVRNRWRVEEVATDADA